MYRHHNHGQCGGGGKERTTQGMGLRAEDTEGHGRWRCRDSSCSGLSEQEGQGWGAAEDVVGQGQGLAGSWGSRVLC